MRIRSTGAERMSKKIRKFAADFPSLAADAAREAAYEIAIPEMQSELTAKRHVWTGKLRDSLMAHTTMKGDLGKDQKYVSLIIDYGKLPYADNFELGGNHRDWPMSKLRPWIQAKNGLTPQEAAKVAKKIQRSLYNKGAEPHPILKLVWARIEAQWFSRYSQKLQEIMRVMKP
jgi:hypothetical protein